jgi:hypothetical protein
MVRLREVKVFKLGPSCVCNCNSGLGRIRTASFAGKNKVLIVTVIFGDL